MLRSSIATWCTWQTGAAPLAVAVPLLGGADRQLNTEGGSLACVTHHTDSASVSLHDPSAQGKAQTRPDAEGFGSRERFENAPLERWWNAGASVRHLEREARARRLLRRMAKKVL